jgi:hypothetical protein
MLYIISNLELENYSVVVITVTVIGITFILFNSYGYMHYFNINRPRPIDTTRVHEGLPVEVTLTPEDFMRNPELAQIFEGADVNQNLDLILESNEHFEEVENQFAAVDYNTLMEFYDIVEAFIHSFF